MYAATFERAWSGVELRRSGGAVAGAARAINGREGRLKLTVR
jgi:hypothetical protein